jgi:hypothetical protein
LSFGRFVAVTAEIINNFPTGIPEKSGIETIFKRPYFKMEAETLSWNE